jgi:hypothetical protein
VDPWRGVPQRRRCGESTLTNGLLRVRHAAPHRYAAFDGAPEIADGRARERRNFGNRGHA